MQDASTTRRLGDLDREVVEHRLRTLFERRASGDIDGMLAMFAHEAIYRSPGAWRVPAYARDARRGRAAIGDMLRAISARFENLGSEFHEISLDGDNAVVLRTATLRDRLSGRVAEIGICNFFRFRDGLIIEFSEYPDTAALALFHRPDGF